LFENQQITFVLVSIRVVLVKFIIVIIVIGYIKNEVSREQSIIMINTYKNQVDILHVFNSRVYSKSYMVFI